MPHLDFRAARELVPYLRDLGVSHLYLSPALQARHDSTHGYDVTDPTRLSEELGGESEFRSLCEAGLGVILDIVPNHMSATDENRFWRDPLRRAKFFDVEWRSGYARRFFDIGDLAGVRVEDAEVFEETHAKVIELVQDGALDGIRVDHLDGLANPTRYLERLREAGVEHVWVEKILEASEALPDWPVEGTTGYEFANEVTGLFVDPAAEEPLTSLYRDFTGEEQPFASLSFAAKLEQTQTTFAPEVEWLRERLGDAGQDFDLPRSLASFPVYRTYVDPDRGEVDASDRAAIEAAQLPQRLAAILLLEERGHDAFVQRFQQTTPPVVAKGVEDTAFYRYNRLICLNEVGGDPSRFAYPLEDFHTANLVRADRFPNQLLTTTTHDTKRSGDVRARIVALSWLAGEWREHVLHWRSVNAELRKGGGPDANEEYLIYQTLVGAWPLERERLEQYLEKALREAKIHTNWIEPDERWETGVRDFARALYEHEPFRASFLPFADQVAIVGERIALAQTLLKLTCPGVPDISQGDELWNLSLVDPDNRRAVDWGTHKRLLAELVAGAPPRRETAKLYVIWRTLQLRGRRPGAFAGSYRPFDAGPDVCAFTRDEDVLVAVPIRPGATFSAPDGFDNVFDPGDVRVWLCERR